MKLTIKDIFAEESVKPSSLIEESTSLENTIEKNVEENIEPKNRMAELVQSFENKNEIIKEKSVHRADTKKIKEEADRLKSIAKLDEASNNQFTGNVGSVMGLNQTVNTFMDSNKGQTVNSFINNTLNNPNSNKLYNPNYTYLQDAEALRLAISRVLNSGAPVTGIGFYDWICPGKRQ